MNSNNTFRVTPQIISFSPTSGSVGRIFTGVRCVYARPVNVLPLSTVATDSISESETRLLNSRIVASLDRKRLGTELERKRLELNDQECGSNNLGCVHLDITYTYTHQQALRDWGEEGPIATGRLKPMRPTAGSKEAMGFMEEATWCGRACCSSTDNMCWTAPES